MQQLVSGAVTEALAVLASALGAAAFTIGGMITEQDGIQKLMSGQVTLGGWEAAVGLLLLTAGIYLFGYREFWPRLRAFQSR